MYKCCCILPNKWWMIQVLQFFSCEKVTKVIKWLRLPKCASNNYYVVVSIQF